MDNYISLYTVNILLLQVFVSVVPFVLVFQISSLKSEYVGFDFKNIRHCLLSRRDF